ncbi:MAG: hypothetical protein GY944_15865 [bacterium]|nr:hypothetical protein [bacterium]
MDACQTRHSNIGTNWKPLALGAGAIALLMAAGLPAAANTSELPAAYTSVPVSLPAPAPTAAEYAAHLLAQQHGVPTARAPLYKRYRNLKVLSYTRAIDVGNDEVIVKLQSPGKRRSIMMVELKF